MLEAAEYNLTKKRVVSINTYNGNCVFLDIRATKTVCIELYGLTVGTTTRPVRCVNVLTSRATKQLIETAEFLSVFT